MSDTFTLDQLDEAIKRVSKIKPRDLGEITIDRIEETRPGWLGFWNSKGALVMEMTIDQYIKFKSDGK